MAIKLPNGKIARTIAEQVYKNMKDIAFLLSKKDFQILVVEELPEEGSENTLYLVPSDNPEQQNVYVEYIWTGTAFEMVGTTAIDISNMVTTDTNQNIIGEKVFESPVTFYEEIVLSVDAAFVGDILPKVNYNDDLGSSTYAWKDLYLGGSLCFDNTEGANWIKVNGDNCCYFDPYILKIYNLEPPVNAPTSSDYYLGTASKRFGSIYVIDANISGDIKHTNYSIIWNNGIEFKNASNQTLFYVAYDKSVWFYGKLTPSGNPDIGDASHRVKDFYLKGSINGDGNANLDIKNGTTTLRVQPNGFVSSDYFIPLTNNGGDLGVSGAAWRNLYLAGVLTDGTNSVNVADLKALIDYAKAQGWIS